VTIFIDAEIGSDHDEFMKTTTNYPGFDASKSYVGECQVCGHFQVVNNGHLVLHGYERPGCGYINGRCAGEEHVPFELSCEVAKDWLVTLKTFILPNNETRLAALKANEPGLKITIEVSNGYVSTGRQARWSSGMKLRTKLIEIEAGYVHVKQADNDYQEGTTFEQFRQRAVKAKTNDIENIKRDIEMVTAKIASWKYAPEKLQTREEVTEAKKAAQADKAAWSRFYSAQKRLWKDVADAIRDHKRNFYGWQPDRKAFYAAHPFPTDKERAAARDRK
jgi:hypothetical protein